MPRRPSGLRAVENLASRLAELGCAVKTARQPEALGDHREHQCTLPGRCSAVTASRLDEATRREGIAMWRKPDDDFARAAVRGLEAATDDVTLRLTVDGRSVPYLHGRVYPAVATLAGQPATAFPVDRSRQGGCRSVSSVELIRPARRSARSSVAVANGFIAPCPRAARFASCCAQVKCPLVFHM
jgi:hypothetical protein